MPSPAEFEAWQAIAGRGGKEIINPVQSYFNLSSLISIDLDWHNYAQDYTVIFSVESSALMLLGI